MNEPFSLHPFADSVAGAASLAKALGMPTSPIRVHRFPDDESLVTAPECAEIAIVFRALHHPNLKLFELLQAAAALRDRGARKVVLVAPYLPYLRQDVAFEPGQAVSQRVLGAMLSPAFDGFVAVAPHLHRVHDLGEVFPDRPCVATQPTESFSRALLSEPDRRRVLVGPDEESEPLVQQLATAIGAPYVIAKKVRHGDRAVAITVGDAAPLRDRNAVLIDDMVSTGTTLIEVAKQIRSAGALRCEALVCHALFDLAVEDRMREAGIHQVRSCDGIPHLTNAIPLAPVLATGVRAVLKAVA